jgi:hypothetical protein
MNTAQKSVAKIYGCGGLATNILAKGLHDNEVTGLASKSTCFIDTSRSNLTADITENMFYHIGSDAGILDGSGGVRATNAANIVKHATSALSKFKPEWFNIVLCSGAGGSGSVIGPVIARKLLDDQQNVIIVVVGSRSSSQRAESTVKTIQTLEAQAQGANRPLCMVYIDAPFDMSRAEVDKKVMREIGRLLVLASRAYRELDTQDITNFLDYSRVPACQHLPKMLTALITLTDSEVPNFKDNVISIASIYKNEEMPPHGLPSAYDTHGYGNAPGAGEQALHFALSSDRLGTIYRELDSINSEAKKAMLARVNRDSITASVKADDSGLVL